MPFAHSITCPALHTYCTGHALQTPAAVNPIIQALCVCGKKHITDLSFEQIFNCTLYRYPSFYCALLYCARQVLHFYKLEVCGNPASNKSIGTVFQLHLLTLCLCVHFGNSHHFPNFFIIIISAMVIFDVTIVVFWEQSEQHFRKLN